MRSIHRWTPLFALWALAACEGALIPTEAPEAASLQLVPGVRVLHTVTGDYTVNASANPDVLIPSHFAISARVRQNGSVAGNFTWFVETAGGTVDMDGEVTCLPVNVELGRAWIGGVVTRNESTLGGFQQDRHQPGRDIWFRVADRSPGGSGEPDRSTATAGFEGGAGIDTSEEYCELMIWPNDGVPVLSGNLTVR